MFSRNLAGYLTSGLFTLSGLFIGFGGVGSSSNGSYQTVTGDSTTTAKEDAPSQDQNPKEPTEQEEPKETAPKPKAEEPAPDKKDPQPKPSVEPAPAKPPVDAEDKTKKPQDHSPPKEETPFVVDNKRNGEKVVSQNPANNYANNTFGAIWKDKLLDTTNVDWWKPREIKFKQLDGEYLIHSNDFIQAYRDLKQSTKEPDGKTLMEVCKKHYSVLDEDKYLERLDIWSYCKL